MSYCRYGEDSDVYVYGDDTHLECCGCKISPKKFSVSKSIFPYTFYPKSRFNRIRNGDFPMRRLRAKWNAKIRNKLIERQKRPHPIQVSVESISFRTKSRDNMMYHLYYHIQKGDKVPEYAIKRLFKEVKKHGDEY